MPRLDRQPSVLSASAGTPAATPVSRAHARRWARPVAWSVLCLLAGTVWGWTVWSALASPTDAAADAETAVSVAVYPPISSTMTFSHARHASAPCVACHPAATTSVRAVERLLPAKATCEPCHADALDDPERCVDCHPAFRDDAPRWVTPSIPGDRLRGLLNPPSMSSASTAALHFPHRLHAAAEVACVRCHDAIGDARGPSGHRPSMQLCVSCHEASGVRAACSVCHLSGADGLLETDLPSGTLAPIGRRGSLDHRDASFARHAQAATSPSSDCTACHSEDDCRRCHDGVLVPLAEHPSDYVLMHGVDALTATDTCTSCHGTRDFCAACHDQVGLGEQHGPPIGARFHPVGFVDEVTSPDFHGPEAARAMESCVSCHAEQTCITCHAVLNPHPDDFAQRCGAMLARNTNACRKCHVGADLQQIRGRCE